MSLADAVSISAIAMYVSKGGDQSTYIVTCSAIRAITTVADMILSCFIAKHVNTRLKALQKLH